MLKVLLVDDEQIIKSGLKTEVNWEKCGCIVTDEASDGKEALEKIMAETPDIVISDIRMPYKNGLDLMEEVRAIHRGVFFLFISGHDEFTYVQKALKLGASDYILKPIDPKYLESQLLKISDEFQARFQSEENLKSTRRAQVRQFLQRIILQGEADREKVWKEAETIDPGLLSSYYKIVSFQMDHYYTLMDEESEQGDDYFRRTFYNLIDAFDFNSSYRISGSMGDFDLCLIGESEEILEQNLKEGLDKINVMRNALSYTISVAVSETVLHPDRLVLSLDKNHKTLEMKFLKGGGGTYFPEDFHQFNEGRKSEQSLIDTDLLLFYLKEGNPEEMHKVLKVIEESLSTIKEPRNALKLFATEILLEILKIMKERELSLEEVMDDPMKEWDKLSASQTAEVFFRKMGELLKSVGSYINVRRDYHSSQIMDQALVYIKENYADGSFSLEDAAARTCMSSCYFSVIFKQEMGSTFNRYLTNYRINKAKDMILYTSLRSYEIGPKVGYENPSYFSTVFKKATGFSPSEYRKNYS